MPDRPDGTTVFDEVAERYARFRPDYQPELIDDIVSLSGIPPGGRILEIGCGPGKATLPFAQRGYAMLCLDPGPRLVALARERVRDYAAVQFAVTTFEDWPLEESAFDLVIAASAFHWIREEVALPKAAAALKDTGAIALFRNAPRHEDTPLYREIQRAYAEHAPELEHGRGRRRRSAAEGLEASGLFRDLQVRHHPWKQTFSAQEYVNLLDTYSGHRSLPAERRAALFAAILTVIKRSGGTIEVPYVGTVQVARKRVG